MSEVPRETIQEVMRHLGSRTSEAKAKSAAENGRATRFTLKPLEQLDCTCGGQGLDHKSYCPRGRSIRYRQKKGLPLEGSN